MVNAVFNGFAALGWMTLAVVFRIAPAASWLMALGHATRMLALRCDDCLNGWPQPIGGALSDLAALSTILLLALAVRRMLRLHRRWGDIALVGALGAIAILTLSLGGSMRGSLIAVSLAMALLALLAGRDIVTGAGPGLAPGVTALMSLPYFGLTLLWIARAAVLAIAPQWDEVFVVGRRASPLMGWIWLVMTIAISVSLVALLLWRLIGRIEHLTRSDALTGCFNRRALNSELAELQRLRERGHPHALVMVDIDHFKRINDTHGHAAGDAALRHCVAVLSGCLRDIDRFGRLGGEEFCALLPHTSLDDAARVAERMRAALAARPLVWHGREIAITASFGVAAGQPDDPLGELGLALADREVYRAKAAGRDLVCTTPTEAPT